MRHPVQTLQAFDQIKLLSDPRRRHLLQLLMAEPASLSGLGRQVGRHPAWVRHHLLRLEQAGLVERIESTTHEQRYRPSARAYVVQALVLPQARLDRTLVLSGSHDLALEMLGSELASALEVVALTNGSLDGLILLRQGLSQMAGCHLFDAVQMEYNRPYVAHLFPDRPMVLVTLAERVQGILFQSGNPKHIRDLSDFARDDVVIRNRNRGSGTRLWLDASLQLLGIPAKAVHGYPSEVSTHTQLARAVSHGEADVGLGLQAAACAFGLGFLPLFQERYHLVVPEENLSQSPVQSMLDHLNSATFRRRASRLAGYDTTHTGELQTVH
jgi:putative molybdopterin biosynthesis protein